MREPCVNRMLFGANGRSVSADEKNRHSEECLFLLTDLRRIRLGSTLRADGVCDGVFHKTV